MSHGHLNSLLLPHVIDFYNEKDIDVLSFLNSIGFKNVNQAVVFFKNQLLENDMPLINKNVLTIDEQLILEIKSDMCFKTSPISIDENEINAILEKIIE